MAERVDPAMGGPGGAPPIDQILGLAMAAWQSDSDSGEVCI